MTKNGVDGSLHAQDAAASPTASGGDAASSPKKRRKVNHGSWRGSPLPRRLESATDTFSYSVYLLSALGEPQRFHCYTNHLALPFAKKGER